MKLKKNINNERMWKHELEIKKKVILGIINVSFVCEKKPFTKLNGLFVELWQKKVNTQWIRKHIQSF